MKTIFKIMYIYQYNSLFVDISYDLDKHRTTVSGYADLVRETITEHIASNRDKLGGLNDLGSPKIVEIDESLFFKRKYNRRIIKNGQWYIGGIEKGTNKTLIVPVERINANTIIQVIVNNVLPGKIIIIDQWRAYSTAFRSLPNYQHLSVNHSLNFLDPINAEIHTQTIEGFWSQTKKIIRDRNGISQE
ncbi:hypothetical protein DMUE_2726 [Dictyocoela muelleri]|nr:hypothetical protein DMUE_2726 [Dictyocoela muelleri]